MFELNHNKLQTSGWTSASLGSEAVPILPQIVAYVASLLGTPVAGRGKAKIESISPRDQAGSRPSTLSRRFGYAALPLHSDTAHWTTPCRYVVLACAKPGRIETPTVLLDTKALTLTDDDRALAQSACFMVRNGRRSFYASIMNRSLSLIRIDPGCMEPLDESAAVAMNIFSYEKCRHQTIEFHWKTGDVLIIDNWRLLHGRGNSTAADPDRHLVRIYVQ
jgi:hypothetical protein